MMSVRKTPLLAAGRKIYGRENGKFLGEQLRVFWSNFSDRELWRQDARAVLEGMKSKYLDRRREESNLRGIFRGA